MKVTMKAEEPFKINMTLSVTMSVEEWNKTKDDLNKNGGPMIYSGSHKLVKAIEDLTKQATNQFVHNNEEKQKAD